MSLRQRLLFAVAAALFASLALGTWITAWQAAHTVRAELAASLKSGRRSVAASLQDMAAPAPRDALVRLVAGFDGNQHVMAALLMEGQSAVASRPAVASVRPPAWFAALAAPHLPPVDLPLRGGVLRLTAVQDSEIGERWIEAGRLFGVLALSAALAALFCFATAAWSLRPLQPLTEALARMEQGLAVAPVAVGGPPEILRLAAAFNRMQEGLGRAARENRRLSAQLESLADEERAELARDLHDDIGPLLFALTAWAAAARLQQSAGDSRAVLASLTSLESAAAALQAAIRGLLRRLRDSAPAATDLHGAVQDLLAFWRGIRPQTEFTARIAPGAEAASEPVRAALYRVAQEGISNAIRHGDATLVALETAIEDGVIAMVVQDNGNAAEAGGSGLGLTGLEERLQAVGGALHVQRGTGPGEGWRLIGRAPLSP